MDCKGGVSMFRKILCNYRAYLKWIESPDLNQASFAVKHGSSPVLEVRSATNWILTNTLIRGPGNRNWAIMMSNYRINIYIYIYIYTCIYRSMGHGISYLWLVTGLQKKSIPIHVLTMGNALRRPQIPNWKRECATSVPCTLGMRQKQLTDRSKAPVESCWSMLESSIMRVYKGQMVIKMWLMSCLFMFVWDFSFYSWSFWWGWALKKHADVNKLISFDRW